MDRWRQDFYGGPLARSHAAGPLAAEAAARAERTSDDQADAAYQSALAAISTNHAEQAEMKLRLAIEYAHAWYKSHLLLAQLLHFTGHDAASKSEAKAALDFAGERMPEVAQALRDLGYTASAEGISAT